MNWVKRSRTVGDAVEPFRFAGEPELESEKQKKKKENAWTRDYLCFSARRVSEDHCSNGVADGTEKRSWEWGGGYDGGLEPL